MLAILANPTFQLLYERVANGLVDVANLQSKCNGTDNFSAVLQSLSIGKKESLGKTLESPSGNPATVFMGLGIHFLWCAYSPYGYECNKRAQTAELFRFFSRCSSDAVKTS